MATDGPAPAEPRSPEEQSSETPLGPPGKVASGPHEEIDHPARLLRLASMTRAMLDEVRQVELDERGRARLAEIHRRLLQMLGEAVSDNLRDELDEVALSIDDGPPSDAELRVAQAQVLGWLEGVFHGIQATIAAQQAAAQQQLAQLRRRQALPPPERPTEQASGLYL
ncbi:MAG: bacterial proteasome activator family protein [Actinomycetota bacterium]|nr:bacterial proteasome activator family protein [Actinomycetota bacterium]